MKVLLLANAFKGSLSAADVAACVPAEYRKKFKTLLISDGGDGFLDSVSSCEDSVFYKHADAENAYGKIYSAPYLFNKKTSQAYIETAKIAGFNTLKNKKLHVMKTGSRGVGQVISSALKAGAKKIYIGLGGVACNDGGAGMLEALGAEFYDVRGKKIKINTRRLKDIGRVDFSALKKYKKIKFYAVSDVSNKLLGRLGSAAVFGPQKGATQAEVRELERGLKNLSSKVTKHTGKNFAVMPASGAAGAIGFGALAGLGAEVLAGTDFIFKKLGVEKAIKKAGIIISTEGKLDRQSFMGKTAGRIAELAKKNKKDFLFICGISELSAREAAKKGIKKVYPLAHTKKCQKNAIKNSKLCLYFAFLTIIRDNNL
ncbi:glycerate kinase [Parelusimicrobium proximum]|uniref:glycerate kinase family protein n=1 Tax=Parelusimicrobium proximum TaxID=3228953 RepID=UPI003D182BA5